MFHPDSSPWTAPQDHSQKVASSISGYITASYTPSSAPRRQISWVPSFQYHRGKPTDMIKYGLTKLGGNVGDSGILNSVNSQRRTRACLQYLSKSTVGLVRAHDALMRRCNLSQDVYEQDVVRFRDAVSRLTAQATEKFPSVQIVCRPASKEGDVSPNPNPGIDMKWNSLLNHLPTIVQTSQSKGDIQLLPFDCQTPMPNWSGLREIRQTRQDEDYPSCVRCVPIEPSGGSEPVKEDTVKSPCSFAPPQDSGTIPAHPDTSHTVQESAMYRTSYSTPGQEFSFEDSQLEAALRYALSSNETV